MPDVRPFSAGSSLVPQTRQAVARVETVRAAQRAFFEAALATSTTPVPASQAASTSVARQSAPSAPQGFLRPGSLVDIKV